VGISGVKVGLLCEYLTVEVFSDISKLASVIKALAIKLISASSIDEVISIVGGVLPI